MTEADDEKVGQVDEALRLWRQGDCVLGELWFLFRLNVDKPLTDAAIAAAAEGSENAETEVLGLMVATQTCDIVRSCKGRPYVEVCPLVKVDKDYLSEIRRNRRPNYAFVPGVEAKGLVADLDRIMTVEKSVVASWNRISGCPDDNDIRNLSQALARKRARKAFPEDFVTLVYKLQKRLSDKHNKNSEEGRALRALREIRVCAAPSWDAEQVEIMFLFIRNEEEPKFANKSWDQYLKAWLDLLPKNGRFKSVDGRVSTLDDLTARDYVESDPLDLDHLSTREDEN